MIDKIDKNTRIGIVGVGLMGHGIAANIVKHGFPLVLLGHAGNQPVEDLLQGGATQVDALKEIAAQADAIILCVTGTPQIEAVLYGPDGLLAHMHPGTILIDCSTAIPSSTEQIARDVTRAQGRFLDAPMTRTPKEAAQGRLNLIIGGDQALFESCRLLLECFAENIVHAGPIGAGHRMKLIHNFVSLGFSTVLAEAAACASRSKIDPKVLLEILASGGGSGAVLTRLAPYIEFQDDSGFRFSVANAHKDLSYYTTMAEESHSFHDTATAILKTLTIGMQADPAATMPQLIKILKELPSTAESV